MIPGSRAHGSHVERPAGRFEPVDADLHTDVDLLLWWAVLLTV